MTKYQEAYEAQLQQLLAAYSTENAEGGQVARGKAAAEAARPAIEGGFGYMVSRMADDVIVAELRSQVATMIGEAHVDATATQVLAHVQEHLRRLQHDALTGGRSTNPWHNMVVTERGRAATTLLENSWEGLGDSMAYRARWAAESALAVPQAQAVQAAREAVREANGRVVRARSGNGKAAAVQAAEQAQARLVDAEEELQRVLAAAGAPAR